MFCITCCITQLFPQYENNFYHLADEKLDLSKYNHPCRVVFNTWVAKPENKTKPNKIRATEVLKTSDMLTEPEKWSQAK